MLPIQIGQESYEARDVHHGCTEVGTTEVGLINPDLHFHTGIVVRAPGADDPTPNTAPVWIGRKGVTANNNEQTGGFPVMPGAVLTIPVDRPAALYCISTAAGQTLAWMGV